MRTFAMVSAALVACAGPHKEGRVEDQELDIQIMLLETPLGGEPHVRERQRAAAWLLAHAERSYPRLLAKAAQGTARPAVVELLPEFGREDSVPVLAGLVWREESMGSVAAWALARHPSHEAFEALLQGLRAGGDRAVRCADGLGVRGDRAACPDLKVAAVSPDAEVRYHAIQAGVGMGCFSREELERIEASDGDVEVRGLARRLRGS